MFDTIIRGGTIVDGTGSPSFVGDIAVTDGKIVEIADHIDGAASRVIDATGKLVTPGWVDVHTHYDGQVTWDTRLDPSAGHGVTTVVTGNCGVGFAPVQPGQEDWLVQLMEGVEDIPGAALSEGISWGWESFPEYLDNLESRHFAMDVGTQLAHGPLRGYVMGERGARNEPASPEEIARMADLVKDAIAAGALGFSTSRTLAHRARDGEPVPGTFAEPDELFALGHAVADGGGGTFEVAQGGLTMLDRGSTTDELGWMAQLSAEAKIPVSYIVLQTDTDPQLWSQVLDEADRLTTELGAELYAQIAARPFGMLIGLSTNHPFMKRPSYQPLAELDLAERARRMADPAVRAAILSEEDLPADPAQPFDGIAGFLAIMVDKLFPLDDNPNYEPLADTSIGNVARAAGLDPIEHCYDLMVADDGAPFFLLPLFNYADGNHDAMFDMLNRPNTISGLGDAGAHCGMICDASIPTYLLTHWVRDRDRGPRLPIELVVHKQTAETAALYGLGDRGELRPGLRADINIIDFDNLRLRPPELIHDLPAGGRRLIQRADGYVATFVAGELVSENGIDTGARPGRLIRGRVAAREPALAGV